MNNEMTIRMLSLEDLIEADCFDVLKSIEVCEKAFIEYASNRVIFPDKVAVIFDQKTQNRINCLPAAILAENVYGMKWVSVFPNNPKEKQLPNLTAVILLSELETGFPVAFMEGSLVSNLRTAAVGTICAKYCAKEDAKTIGFIGSGEQAKTHFLTMKAIRPSIHTCKVSSRHMESVDAFIEQMKKRYPDVEFVNCGDDYKKAADDSDIIVTAISGQEQILQAEWVKPGAFYCHVGGLEDAFAVPKKANKIICDSWEVVKHRTQTISQMYQKGLLTDNDIYADLHEIIMGDKPGRENDDEFIYFNSVGMSFLDVALSNWMYKRATEKGLGQTISLKQKSMFDFDNWR